MFNQKELIQINDAVTECVNSLIRIDGEKQFMKDVAERLNDELGLEKALFNRVVKERFDSKVSKNVEKLEESVEFNEELLTAARNANTITVDPDNDEE